MFGYDSGYDTDDTDELLARKGCAHVPICTVSETALRQHSSVPNSHTICGPDRCSVIVNEDWLFSLDSTRQHCEEKQEPAGDTKGHGHVQCPETAARQEMGICNGAQPGVKESLRHASHSGQAVCAQAAAIVSVEKAGPQTATPR